MKNKKDGMRMCCQGAFPTFAIILLAIGIVWLLNDLGLFIIKIPWIPTVLIIIAIGMIINRYSKKE